MCFIFSTGHHNLSYILDNDYGRYNVCTFLKKQNTDIYICKYLKIVSKYLRKNKCNFLVIPAVNDTVMKLICIYKYLHISRSLPEKHLYRVSGAGKLAMIQTYAGMLGEVFHEILPLKYYLIK